MKKSTKFATAAIVCMLFINNLNGIIYASEADSANVSDNASPEETSDYEEINYSLNYLGYDSEDTIYCTDYIEASGASGMDTKVAVLYTDTEMIGEYVKTYSEETDETRTCFLVENNEEVFEALAGGESGMIEVSVDGESIELTVDYDETEQEDIETEEFELREYQVDITTANNKVYYPTTAYDVEMMLKITSGAEGYMVKVKNVDNAKLSNGAGLCWAACGASIVNFIMGTNYSAESMFNKVNAAISGTPTGTVRNMKAMLDVCLLKYYQKSGKLTYSLVLDQHKKGSPVMCCIWGENTETGLEGGHVVVLCGSFHISTSYGYVYMDPNVHNKLVINYMDYSQITSASDDLYYFGGYEMFFNKCDYTFFNFGKGV